MKKENELLHLKNKFKIGDLKWKDNLNISVSENLFLNKNQSFEYKVTTEKPELVEEVYLHLQITATEWVFKKLSLNEKNEFTIELKYKTCGMYFFRLLYKLKKDEMLYWNRQNYTKCLVEPEDIQNLSIYTYLPNVSGKIKDWIKDFKRIKDMGFNTIHILPITQSGFSQSPYAAKELMHIDKNYIQANEDEELSDLVDFCFNEKIKLCIDLVFNHVSSDSFICRNFPHWIHADENEPDGFKRAGCWHNHSWVKWEDIVLINYDHPHIEIKKEIWSYMTSYGLYWSEIANMTNGMIRLDNLHSTPFAFIDHALAEIKNKFPDLLIQAELFAADDVIQKYMAKGYINLLFATPWLNPYAENFREQITALHNNNKHLRYIFPVNSHDSGSNTEMYGKPEAVVPRYGAIALLGCGQTGLVQGSEYDIQSKINFIGYQKKINLPINEYIAKSLKKINETKNNFKVFHQSKNIKFIDNANSAVLACIRNSKTPNEPEFIIIANFNTHGLQQVSLDLQDYQNKMAINHITNESISLASLQHFAMSPLELLILEIKK